MTRYGVAVSAQCSSSRLRSAAFTLSCLGLLVVAASCNLPQPPMPAKLEVAVIGWRPIVDQMVIPR
jgi:hypothetical protein